MKKEKRPKVPLWNDRRPLSNFIPLTNTPKSTGGGGGSSSPAPPAGPAFSLIDGERFYLIDGDRFELIQD